MGVGTRVEARYEGGDEWYAGVIEVSEGTPTTCCTTTATARTGLDKTLIRREIALSASYSNAFESLRAERLNITGQRAVQPNARPASRGPRPDTGEEVTAVPAAPSAGGAGASPSRLQRRLRRHRPAPERPADVSSARRAQKFHDGRARRRRRSCTTPAGVDATPPGASVLPSHAGQ